MATFKSVVTKLGQASIAAAIQSGKDINIIEMAIGDGGGKSVEPVATQTQLVKEVYRTKLNSLRLDAKNANWVIAETIISASVGGFWMREMGLYADDGTLIAVCNMADTYKPTLAEGSGRTQTLRMVISVTDTSAVSLTIDDSLIVATEEYVNDLLADHEKSRNHPDGSLTEKGFLQLSSDINSSSETLAATSKAVKAANDNANSRLASSGTAVAAQKLANSRKIAGKDFDGTKDVQIGPDDVGAFPSSGGTLNGNMTLGELIATKGLISTNGYAIIRAIYENESKNQYSRLVLTDAAGDVALGYIEADYGRNVTFVVNGRRFVMDKNGNFNAPVGIFEAGKRVFSPSNKPTYADVGALSENGGTLYGPLVTQGQISTGKGFNIYSAENIVAAGGVYEGNMRVYSPNYRPTPADIGALPSSGGKLGGPLTVAGQISTEKGFNIYASQDVIAGAGGVYEQGRRVYSPNNPPPIPAKTVASLGVHGWSRNLDTGEITQWGNFISGSGQIETHNFPIAFPNNCTVVVGSVGVLTSGNPTVNFEPVNNMTFNSKAQGAGFGIYWEARGY